MRWNSVAVAFAWAAALGCSKDVGLPRNPDNTLPRVTIVSPPDGSVAAGEVEVVVRAVDEEGPIARVERAVDGASPYDLSAGPADPDIYRYSWTIPADGASHTLEVTAYDGQGGSTAVAHTVFAQALELSEDAIVVVQGGDVVEIAVALAVVPTAPTAVAIFAEDPGRLEIEPGNLVFEPGVKEKQVALRAAGDADLEEAQTTITFAAANLPSITREVILRDEDDPEIQVSSGDTLEIREESTPGIIQVALTFVPADSVSIRPDFDAGKVTVIPDDPAPCTGGQVCARTYVVTALGDQDVEPGETRVTFSVDELPAPPSVGVEVAIEDDDVQSLVLPPSVLMLEGTEETFDVRLAYDPGDEPVVLEISSSAARVSVAPAMLELNTINWKAGATITLTAPADSDVEEEDVTVTIRPSGGLPEQTLSLHVADADGGARAVRFLDGDGALASALSLTETGTAAVSVCLSFLPSAEVTFSLVSTDPSSVVADPWTDRIAAGIACDPDAAPTCCTTPVGVTLEAPDNDDLRTDRASTLTVLADGLSAYLDVSVENDDAQAVLAAAPPTLLVGEGAQASFSFALAKRPVAATTVMISTSSTSCAVFPAEFSIAPDEYTDLQTVTVTGDGDLDAEPDPDALIVLMDVASGASTSVPCRVLESDHLALETSVQTIALREGESAPFDVSLTAQPAATVTVALSVVPVPPTSTSTIPTLSATELDFTTSNWNSARTVTVSALPGIGADATFAIELTGPDLSATIGLEVFSNPSAGGARAAE